MPWVQVRPQGEKKLGGLNLVVSAPPGQREVHFFEIIYWLGELRVVQVGVGHKTENEMCNCTQCHVHKSSYSFNLHPLIAGRRVAYRSLRIVSISLTSDH